MNELRFYFQGSLAIVWKIKQHKSHCASNFYFFIPPSPVKLVTVLIWVITVTQRLGDAFALPIPSEISVLGVHLVPGATALSLAVR